MAKLKVVHYINQFFAQIGGEEKADYPVELRVGEVVGPGMALTQNFKDEAEIIATIVCGDSYFNENLEKAKAEILEMQNHIRLLTEKSMEIQAQEARNKQLMEQKFASVRKQVREIRSSQKVVNQYYKNMMKKGYVEPHFLDNKK